MSFAHSFGLVAALICLAGSGPARADVTLINVFEVPSDRMEETIAAWEKARDFLSREPGFRSTSLHRALRPDARFALVNVARWEDAKAFQNATRRMREAGIFPAIEGLRIHPALYTVIRSDAVRGKHGRP
ncbi:MAG: antibiotic biosynthesis monooxygenase family protein [Pseudomonadota bacterium]